MSRSVPVRLLLACSLLLATFGCSRDPNVRKQKYFDSGEKYFAEGKYREAEIQYRNAIQIDARFAQAHYQLSQTYLKLGNIQLAGQELTKTLEYDSENYRAHTDLANLLVASRTPENIKAAVPHLDTLRDKQPNNPETHEAWANYYAAQNNIPDAIKEMQQAISDDPRRSESYLLLALFQTRSNQFDEAEKNFKTAIDVDPKAINAQLALGGFYQSRNRLSDAELQFKQAIGIDPKNPTPRAALVRLLMQEGKKRRCRIFLASNQERSFG